MPALRPLLTLCLLLATAASAQQRPIFDVDDFFDLRQNSGRNVFASRLTVGAAANLANDYRPLDKNTGFLHFTNSFYWSKFQIDFKHTQIGGKTPPLQLCDCKPPLYFPTAPSSDSTPAAPPPGRKETLQFGFYHRVSDAPAEPSTVLRYRLTWSRQPIHTVVTFLNTEQVAERRNGHEESFGLDADTHLRIGERDLWGSLVYARTVRSGTPDNRSQNELAYTHRFPVLPVKHVLLRATLTLGSVSGRGAHGLNVVNPYFEAFWHHYLSQANLHLVWSPQATRSGTGGWEHHNQVALFVDRKLYVKLFH